MINKEGMIVCPRPRGAPPMLIDLLKIKTLETRIEEIARVNLLRAPELLSTFNKIFMELSESIATLEYEKNKAQRDAQLRRSVVTLDEMPKVLRAKGLATDRSPTGSADTREAVLDQDAEYQNALELVEQISAVNKLLKDKRDGFVMAYHSVKRLVEKMRTDMTRSLNAAPDRDLDAGDEDDNSEDFGIPR